MDAQPGCAWRAVLNARASRAGALVLTLLVAVSGTIWPMDEK